jgi:integrase/recombinase XerD
VVTGERVLSRAVDDWLLDLQMAGRTARTCESYRRYAHMFVAQIEVTRPHARVSEVTVEDCRAFLRRWAGKSQSTIASIHSTLSSLFEWLYVEGAVDANPMRRIKRAKRPHPGDVAVTIVTADEVEKVFRACGSWQEFLCVSVLAYTGVRRRAASRLRWRDVNLVAGTFRVTEKGGKVRDLPMADELRAILREAVESSAIACAPDDYVIPNRRSASVRRAERSDKLVYESLMAVAERAGVKATPHAFRRAFAVEFLSTHPGAIESLQALLLHSRVDTTEVYLRGLKWEKRAEAVRDLSWSTSLGFAHQAGEPAQMQGKAHTGFEPVPPP